VTNYNITRIHAEPAVSAARITAQCTESARFC
jgi:hypothetical protein